MKKKILIIILIIILVILIILGIILLRKNLIIKDIIEKNQKYNSALSFSIKSTSTNIEDKQYYSYYKYDDMKVQKIEKHNIDGNTIRIEDYRRNNGTRDLFITDENNKKIAILGEKVNDNNFNFFSTPFEFKNNFDYIKFLLNVKISVKKYNGKEYYCINIDRCLKYMKDYIGNFLLSENQNIKDFTLDFYIEKESGLIVYNPFSQEMIYDYNFEDAPKEEVKEPNISEYEVVQN